MSAHSLFVAINTYRLIDRYYNMNMNKKRGRPCSTIKTKAKNFKLSDEVLNMIEQKKKEMKGKGINTYDELFFYLVEMSNR